MLLLLAAGLMVVSRVDVIPKEGKSVLFCVFVTSLKEYRPWFSRRQQQQCIDSPVGNVGLGRFLSPGRAQGSITGELCEEVIIRSTDSNHTGALFCFLLP